MHEEVSNESLIGDGSCPVCNKTFKMSELERHVNKCLFLNSVETDEHQSRKRPPSPALSGNLKSQLKRSVSQKSPHDKKTFLQKSSKLPFPLFCDNKSISSENKGSTSDAVIDCTTESSEPKYKTFVTPLANQMRPKSWSDFVGQSHVLGSNTVLRTLIEKGEIPNMILWGPPGCGKTSLSTVIQERCKAEPKKWKFVSLCATTSGVKDVQNIISAAQLEMKFGRKTVLFMDEIHRFNKKQQDIFLLSVEKGQIILVGATTENPSFQINNALLSRCRVIVMEKLESSDLTEILEKAAENLDLEIIDDDEDNPHQINEFKGGLAVNTSALKWLADISDGDARIALGNFQMVLQHLATNNIEKIITIDDLKDGIKKSHLLYDRNGEEHYNIISAMHKSIRGSDPNAALYWTTRMIVSGEDPIYIARRMVRAASEDIGNADPNALQLAIATMQGCQLVGMPEADCLLSQCAIYLARAPKSREADSALAKAKAVIKQCRGPQPAVPMHIRNAPTRLMKDLGYGQLKPGEEFSFMPPELRDINFFN